jgi:hypothetical protein
MLVAGPPTEKGIQPEKQGYKYKVTSLIDIKYESDIILKKSESL